MKIALSTNFLRPDSVEQLIDVCHAAGVASVEIWGHDGVFAESEDLSESALRLRKANVAVSSLHAPYTIDSLLLPEDREHYLARIESACRKAESLQAGYMVVHPAVLRGEQPTVDGRLSDAMPESFAIWHSVAQRARVRGARVAFENLPGSSGWPNGCRVETVRRISDELGEFDTGVCLDLSHSFANQEEPFITSDGAIEPLVVHVSDGIAGYDRHLPPGEGDHDWDRISNVLCRQGFAGPLVLEVRSPYLNAHLIGSMSEYLQGKLRLALEKTNWSSEEAGTVSGIH